MMQLRDTFFLSITINCFYLLFSFLSFILHLHLHSQKLRELNIFHRKEKIFAFYFASFQFTVNTSKICY
jgi:hypothetical protein